MVPAEEIFHRISRAQHMMVDIGIDGIIIIQRVDLYYFSGTAQKSLLYIPNEGRPTLFVRKYAPRAKEESSIEQIIEIGSVKEIPSLIMDTYQKMPGILGMELDVLPVNDFRFYEKLFDGVKCVDGSPIIHKARMTKSDWEISRLEATAELSFKTFQYMREVIEPGLTEMEFSGMFETFARRLGHGGQLRVRDYMTEGYPWHVLSGESGGMVGLLDAPASGAGTSPAFPCGAGSKKLVENEPIMIDFGAVLDGYHIDETRMFAIRTMPEKAHQASLAAIEIHNRILEKAKPGVTTDALYQFSLDLSKSLGYEESFLGPPEHKVTFVGHGIGLELVEPPIIAKNRGIPLEPGMVFALEPKMVFENKFSAGIESVFCVTETGARLISKVPVEIFTVNPR
jgi:Xaa-Pro aminopeptidase